MKITTKQRRRRLCRLVGVVGAICHTTNKNIIMIRLFFTLFCVALIYGVTLLREDTNTNKQTK